MKSMKLTDEEKNEYCQPSALVQQPEYPYGLKLCLDAAAVDKLGLKKLPEIGQALVLTARVEVCARSECLEEGEGEVERSLSLQITDLDLAPARESASAAQVLFGKGEAKA